MSQFSERRPYWSGLVKRVITLVVTWNVVMVLLFGSLIVLSGLGFLFSGLTSSTSAYETVYGKGYDQFLSIRLSGTVLGSRTTDDGLSNLFDDGGSTYGYDIKDELYEAAEDDTIRGVILEIDSPGGVIYGATAVADGVKYYREQTGRPVYAHIQGTGASAAYWSAVSTDRVFADYGSAVGSVGVIMGPFEYYDKVVATDGGLLGGGVITQNGIESVYLTAGKSKDVGNPYRKLTADETAMLQKTVNNEYDGFVKYVSQRRGISEDVIRNQIGAMIYDPKSAVELKLVDNIGSRQQAYAALARAAGTDDYSIVRRYSEPGLVASLLGAFNRQPAPQAATAKVDLCALTKSPLAYYGDITAWCAKPQ